MAQKTSYRAESAVLLRGAAGTSGAQKLVTRPTGGPEEGTTATGGAQRAEGVELGKSDVQWPGGFGVCRLTANSRASSEISVTNRSFCHHWSQFVDCILKDNAECFKKRSH